MHQIGDLALADDGNPVLTGNKPEFAIGASQDMSAIKYDADTGAERWHFATGKEDGTAWQVALAPTGDLFIGGEPMYYPRPSFTVAALRQRLAGGKLVVLSQNPTEPVSRLKVRSDDRGSFVPRPSSAADPRVDGAALELRNPSTGEVEVIPLADANLWNVVGPVGRQRGYVYRDRSGLPGTCRRINVSPRGRIGIDCRLATLTLDEATQGALAVKLTLGAGLPFCMEFGGASVTADAPTTFAARNAGPPAACS